MQLPPLDLDQPLTLQEENSDGPLSPSAWDLPGGAAAALFPPRAARQQEASLAGWNPQGAGAAREGEGGGGGSDTWGAADYADQVATLLEERDSLVDRLLATTQALHAAEAKQREGAAAAAQVQGLMTQLQDLLRRAEAERDKAQRQLQLQAMQARRNASVGAPGTAGVQPLPPLPPLDTAGRQSSMSCPSGALSPQQSSGTPINLSAGVTPTAAAAAAAATLMESPSPRPAGKPAGGRAAADAADRQGSELRQRRPAAAGPGSSPSPPPKGPFAAAASAADARVASKEAAKAASAARGGSGWALFFVGLFVGIAVVAAAVLATQGVPGAAAPDGGAAPVATHAVEQLQGRVRELEAALQQLQHERVQEKQLLAELLGLDSPVGLDEMRAEVLAQCSCGTAAG